MGSLKYNRSGYLTHTYVADVNGQHTRKSITWGAQSALAGTLTK